jgi:hypothetical protein
LVPGVHGAGFKVFSLNKLVGGAERVDMAASTSFLGHHGGGRELAGKVLLLLTFAPEF